MNPLKKFQRKHGLLDDGILGEKTFSAFRKTFGIETKEATAHFLGQIIHETGNFAHTEESFYYSAPRLLEVFGKYFTQKEAKKFAYNEQAIANRVYANRMGNGNEASGDGYKYRGRGAIMVTGRNNYEMMANKLGDLCILETPYLVIDRYFFAVAKVFFDVNDIWRFCDTVDEQSIRRVTRVINGGYNGLADRIYWTNKMYAL